MKKNGPIGQEAPASWLATFGDLACLLLTFYVLIYASSTYEPGEWETAHGALQRMLGIMPGKSASSLMEGQGAGMLSAETQLIPLMTRVIPAFRNDSDAVRGIEEVLSMAGSVEYESDIDVEMIENGLKFRMREPVSFKPGSAEMDPRAQTLLGSIAKIVRNQPGSVVVEGHTCNLPIHSGRYMSNWDLSGARAAEVVRYLVDEGIGESGICAKACGEYHPIMANQDEASRRINRRVEISLTFNEQILD